MARTFIVGLGRVVPEVHAPARCPRAGNVGLLPVLHYMREGEVHVLFGRTQHKVTRVEIDERVEQHVRGVCAQLLALPKVLLLYPTHDHACGGAASTHHYQ